MTLERLKQNQRKDYLQVSCFNSTQGVGELIAEDVCVCFVQCEVNLQGLMSCCTA